MKTKKDIFPKILIYILYFLMVVIVISSKRNLHIDEMGSYVLANHEGVALRMTPEEGMVYQPSSSIFLEYITVQSGEQFNIQNVWNNQKRDVHPPFYYLILHIICSFFPEQYSVWFAGSINIIFSMLTLLYTRKLTFELTGSNAAVVFVSLFYVTSIGILTNVSFFRMYVMAMFFVTCITYQFIRLIQTRGGISKKNLIIIAFVALLGALTHYYFIVYLVLCCMVLGIYLLLKKQYSEIGMLIGVLGIAGGISVLVFPSMIKHMFLEGRGSESIDNLLDNSLTGYFQRIKSFYDIINQQLFGGFLRYLILFIFVTIIVLVICERRHIKLDEVHVKKMENGELIKWILLFVPCICYFFIVSKIAVYLTGRYMFPIYAVLLITIICALYMLSGKFTNIKCQNIVAGILLIVVIASSWNKGFSGYLYRDSVSLLEKLEEYTSVNCLYIYDANYKIEPSFYEVSNFNSVMFWDYQNINFMQDIEYCMDTELIVYLTNSCDQQIVLDRIMEICPLLDSYEEIGSYGYSKSYYLYGH